MVISVFKKLCLNCNLCKTWCWILCLEVIIALLEESKATVRCCATENEGVTHWGNQVVAEQVIDEGLN